MGFVSSDLLAHKKTCKYKTRSKLQYVTSKTNSGNAMHNGSILRHYRVAKSTTEAKDSVRQVLAISTSTGPFPTLGDRSEKTITP